MTMETGRQDVAPLIWVARTGSKDVLSCCKEAGGKRTLFIRANMDSRISPVRERNLHRRGRQWRIPIVIQEKWGLSRHFRSRSRFFRAQRSFLIHRLIMGRRATPAKRGSKTGWR